MTLWFIFALMTALAVFAVLWPLSRRDGSQRSGSDLAVYREQLAEIDHDLEIGLIAPSEAEAARLEVSRRLLNAAEQSKKPTAASAPAAASASAPAPAALWRRRAVALVAMILVPLGSVAIYLAFGSPHMSGMQIASRGAPMPNAASLADMLKEVEAHLAKNPDDIRGWEILAPIYMRISHFEGAVRARHNILRLKGADAQREGDLGEALVAEAGGMVTGEAKEAFERALKHDADDLRARYFSGLAAEQDGKREEAAKIWREILANAPVDAPYRPIIEDSLARVEQPAKPEGSSGAEDDSIARMSLDQRREMIVGMVERLSERLKQDDSDLEGWVRLMRAYASLGERDKAQLALDNARRVAGDDAEIRKALDDVARALGLKV